MSYESLGEIARSLDEPLHRVEYVIRSRRIRPDLIAGGRHLYSKATKQRIASEIREINVEKGVKHV